MSGVKVGGLWKTPSIVYTKVGNQWKIVAQTFTKVNGVWRTTTFGSPPSAPIMGYISTGVFNITNYDSTLVYQATLISGSGTATLNTSTGRYTLSSANARFSVVARYAASSPASGQDFMERRAYTYSCRTVPQTCCETVCIEQCTCGCSGPDPNTGGCPAGSSPNGQCGCGGSSPCMFGCIGCKTFGQNCFDCTYTVCDVLINQPGYINSGTEWYKVS